MGSRDVTQRLIGQGSPRCHRDMLGWSCHHTEVFEGSYCNVRAVVDWYQCTLLSVRLVSNHKL
jgi:hypothetical protein